jgi:hypothetical protein
MTTPIDDLYAYPGDPVPGAESSSATEPAPGTPEYYDRFTQEIYASVLDYQDRLRGSEPPQRSDDDAPGPDLGGDDPRPQIVIGPDITAVVDAAERALAKLDRVYVRGRKLARVVRDYGRSDWMRRPDGSPTIIQLRPAALLELLSRAAIWITVRRNRNGDTIPSRTTPPAVVAAALNEREEWSLPQIEGVAESPVFRADGTILDVPGYDPQTRLIYDPRGERFPPVPEAPTHAHATQALADLLEPFDEFPFVDDSARAATAALVLSIVGRSAIPGQVPLFSAQAPTPGSGKGLLVAAASLIAIGRLAPLMAQTSDEEENRKRLLALAIESPQLVVIDNVEGTFGSPSLAMALTTGEVRDRRLGATETVAATLRSVWAITGNNVQFRSDFGRRVVPIDLDPQVERPEQRTFRRGDLLNYVEAQRPKLVVAALTLLRAYVVAGHPSHGLGPVGSYESWDRLVRGAVVWAGGVDPMGGVPRVQAEADDDVERIRSLLYAWRVSLGGVAKTVIEAVRWADNADGDLKEAMCAFCKDGKLNGRAIGYAFRKVQGRIVAGMRLKRAGEDRNHNAQWVVEEI